MDKTRRETNEGVDPSEGNTFDQAWRTANDRAEQAGLAGAAAISPDAAAAVSPNPGGIWLPARHRSAAPYRIDGVPPPIALDRTGSTITIEKRDPASDAETLVSAVTNRTSQWRETGSSDFSEWDNGDEIKGGDEDDCDDGDGGDDVDVGRASFTSELVTRNPCLWSGLG